jgi:hypothetical protein
MERFEVGRSLPSMEGWEIKKKKTQSYCWAFTSDDHGLILLMQLSQTSDHNLL